MRNISNSIVSKHSRITAHSRSALAALAVMFASGSAAFAQSTPNPGERPINTFVFKGTHNSYERSGSIGEQIQRYSTFQVEIDMFWREDRANNRGPGVMVENFCSSSNGGLFFEDVVTSINAASDGADERVVFIYLEMKPPETNLCYDEWPSLSVYTTYVMNVLQNRLGINNFYTPREFVDVDASSWPSMQELNRRGYRYVVLLDERTRFTSDFFFISGGNDPAAPDTFAYNSAFINQANGQDSGERDAFVQTSGPRWLNRCYSIFDLCIANDGPYWDDSVDRGFNFVATNCVDDAETITDPRIHSPSPMYVQPTAPASQQWGTIHDPMTNLYAAILRTSPAVNIRVKPGIYDIPNNTPISRPLKITADGGTIRIQ
jgi:hypothetical protein